VRGVFRLLRIFILVRKLNAVRIRREIIRKREISQSLDLRAPLEIVLDMLCDLRDRIDSSERKVIANLNYCIQ